MSRARRLVTGVAALSIVATTGLGALPAVAEEGEPAEPTAEQAPAEDEAAAEEDAAAEESEETPAADPENDPNGHKMPKEDPGELELLIGQSIQVRANADGEQNSNLANFRWAVTQITAEGTTGESVDVFLPMAPAPLLRSLNEFGGDFEQTDEGVTFPFEDVNGVELQRTLNLWPQDGPESELPVSLETEFTLNGEVVSAQDIVGASGEVTATYRITNNTTEMKEVTYTNLGGDEVTEEVESDVPYVVISKALIPQSWARYNPGGGIIGADGRGRWQTQWISLPFRPLNQSGVGEFGWTAIIPEGEGYVPGVLIEAAPLFHAESEGAEDTTDENDTSGGLGLGGLDLSNELGTVKAGATQLVLGIGALGDVIGDALGSIKAGIGAGGPQIGQAIQELGQILGGGGGPPLTETLQTAIDLINQLDSALGSLPASPDQIDQIASALAAAQGAGITDVPSLCAAVTDSGIAARACEAAIQAAGATGALNTILGTDAGDIEAVANLLRTVEGANAVLQPLGAALQAILDLVNELSGPLSTLGAGIGDITGGIGEALAALPGAGAAIDDIVNGIGQLKVGVGGIGAEVKVFLGGLIAVAQDAIAAGKDVAQALAETVNTLKAQLAGMLQRMHESPLPYNGPDNDAGLEYTDQLFGAVQFVVDPADNNAPNTVPRILLAILVLVGAGFAGKALAGRGSA
jgi:hypothetical protein